MKFRPLTPHDYPRVKAIYEAGIATGNATFETQAPAWEDWDKNHLKIGRIAAINDQGNLIGWASLAAVSGRCIYAGVAEVSVYVDPLFRGQGIGRQLLNELVKQSEENNLWTLQAGIFPENKASIKMHEACGFRQVGVREKIGKMKGLWRDTVLLERRSQKVGAD